MQPGLIASVFFDRSVFLASAIARPRSANQVSKLEGQKNWLDRSQIRLLAKIVRTG
ncbi:hypothetical protein QT971_06560 [Microcoleus sp. herbarium19]|uniref:hypothetical protein n=1 Tax=unclassified Microcoleus TaxID=2642155 RepID=UPI002FD14703